MEEEEEEEKRKKRKKKWCAEEISSQKKISPTWDISGDFSLPDIRRRADIWALVTPDWKTENGSKVA